MMDFKFDLQHFAVKISTGGESLGVGSKVTVSTAASGVTAWAETVDSGFKFGASASEMNSTVQVANDDTWAATLGAGPALANVNGISDGAVVWGSLSDASITTDSAGAFSIGGASNTADAFTIKGDSSVTFALEDSKVSTISGVDNGATLKMAAGEYTINNTAVTVSSSQFVTVSGDSVGTKLDVSSVTEETTAEELLKNLMPAEVASVATEADSSSVAAALEDSSNVSALEGDMKLTVSQTTTDVTQTLDLSKVSGKKVVSVDSDSNLNLVYNAQGGNALSVGQNTTGEVSAEFTGGKNVLAVGNTNANVNIKATGGLDAAILGDNVALDVSGLTSDKYTSTISVLGKGYLNLNGYNAKTSNARITMGTYANALEAARAGFARIVNGVLKLGNAAIDFYSGRSSSDVVADLAETDGASADLVEAADASSGYGATLKGNDGVLTGYADSAANSKVDLSDVNENVYMVGNITTDGNVATHNQGVKATLASGDGDDTLVGGDGDVLIGGTGYNLFQLNRSNTSELGAKVVFNTSTGTAVEHAGNASDSVTGFTTGFSAGSDIIVADLQSTSIKLDGSSNLVLASGDHNMTVNGAGTDGAAQVLVSNGIDNTATRVQVASAGSTMSVTSGNLAGYYAGDGSVFDLSSYSSDVYVNLRDSSATADNGTAVVTGVGTVVGGSGTSSLYGSAADEVIQAGTGRTSVWGGAGSDSLVSNNASTTKFGFLAGDGKDTISGFTGISDTSTKNGNYDVLYAQQSYTAVGTEGNNVKVALNADDILTIENAVGQDITVEYNGETYVGKVGNASVAHDGVAGYYYADGDDASVVATANGSANIWLGSESFKTDSANYSGDFKYLNASGISSNATLAGNSNDNYIVGGSAANSVWGGSSTSNDTLVAGSGTNTFFYGVDGNTNEGDDLIVGAGSKDTVRLLNLSVDDITNGSASVSVSSGAVEVNFTGGGSLTLNSNSGTTFALNDGSSWTYDKSASTWKQK